MPTAKKPSKLENDPLWREVCDIAEYIYGKLPELPEEERWDSAVKLRHAANDLMFSCSVALGNASPSATEYDWGQVRKHIYGLKTIYRFAGRQKFIVLDPEIMVRLTSLTEQIDEKIVEAYKQTELHDRADLEHWQKKYQLSMKANQS
jgi:hypothetical protein